MIKMQPSESMIYPDLVLSVPPKLTSSLNNLIESFNKGDEIQFTGKFIALGNEFKMHHMEIVEVEDIPSLEKTGGFKSLKDIIVKESTIPV